MDINTVKKYLRIDFDDDDEIINIVMSAAEEYIKGAVGRFDVSSGRMQLLYLNLISAMYEQRMFTVDTANEKVSAIISSMILQLQLESDV